MDNHINFIKYILPLISIIGLAQADSWVKIYPFRTNESIKKQMPTRIISDSQKKLLKINKSKNNKIYRYEFTIIQENQNYKFSIESIHSCNVFFLTDHSIMFTNDFDASTTSQPIFVINLDKMIMHEIEARDIIKDNKLSRYTTDKLGPGVNRYEEKQELLTPWHQNNYISDDYSCSLICGILGDIYSFEKNPVWLTFNFARDKMSWLIIKPNNKIISEPALINKTTKLKLLQKTNE